MVLAHGFKEGSDENVYLGRFGEGVDKTGNAVRELFLHKWFVRLPHTIEQASPEFHHPVVVEFIRFFLRSQMNPFPKPRNCFVSDSLVIRGEMSREMDFFRRHVLCTIPNNGSLQFKRLSHSRAIVPDSGDRENVRRVRMPIIGAKISAPHLQRTIHSRCLDNKNRLPFDDAVL